MTTTKIKSAAEVVTDFIEAQTQDGELEAKMVSSIRDLRSDGKLTKTKLLQELEVARKTVLADSQTPSGIESDD